MAKQYKYKCLEDGFIFFSDHQLSDSESVACPGCGTVLSSADRKFIGLSGDDGKGEEEAKRRKEEAEKRRREEAEKRRKDEAEKRRREEEAKRRKEEDKSGRVNRHEYMCLNDGFIFPSDHYLSDSESVVCPGCGSDLTSADRKLIDGVKVPPPPPVSPPPHPPASDTTSVGALSAFLSFIFSIWFAIQFNTWAAILSFVFIFIWSCCCFIKDNRREEYALILHVFFASALYFFIYRLFCYVLTSENSFSAAMFWGLSLSIVWGIWLISSLFYHCLPRE